MRSRRTLHTELPAWIEGTTLRVPADRAAGGRGRGHLDHLDQRPAAAGGALPGDAARCSRPAARRSPSCQTWNSLEHVVLQTERALLQEVIEWHSIRSFGEPRTEPPAMNTPFKYRAFISYSHSDEKWARWLHRSLETYRLPQHLVGTQTGVRPGAAAVRARVPRPRRARDRDQPRRDADRGARAVGLPDRHLLADGREVALGQRGNPRLQAARPRAPHLLPDRGRRARAPRRIPAHGRPRVLPARADPRARRGRRAHDERSEPIAADVRPGKDRKATALLKLLAGMLGIGFDDLRAARSQPPLPPPARARCPLRSSAW